nr:MAG TPA: hypothetical protein [Caudoviricetes sp.]
MSAPNGITIGPDGLAVPIAAEFAPEADKYNRAVMALREDLESNTATQPTQTEPLSSLDELAPEDITGTPEETPGKGDEIETEDPRKSKLYALVTPLEELKGSVALQLMTEAVGIWEAVTPENGGEASPSMSLAATRALREIFTELIVPEDKREEWEAHDTLAGIAEQSNFISDYVGEVGNVIRSLNI